MHPLVNKILSVDGHRTADSTAVANGIRVIDLMESAGEAVAKEIILGWSARKSVILCGPGNNGGDGFVVARLLANAGWPVTIALLVEADTYRGDAAEMLTRWDGPVISMSDVSPSGFNLFVDAIFGAGLSRPLDDEALRLARDLVEVDVPIVSIDVPSGVQGDTGRYKDIAIRADLTVTFHCLKPAHCLQPGRASCGEIVLADIGIPGSRRVDQKTVGELNTPALWPQLPGGHSVDTHKHRKGRLCVVSGGATSTGAARLAAMSGLRSGAGLVTLLSPPAAIQVNAMNATAIMLKRFEDAEGLIDALDDRRATATVIGPGGGVGEDMRQMVVAATSRDGALILDADALTSFEDDPEHLFQHLRLDDVLTPHEGEFARLFPDLMASETNKIERAQVAAKQAGCVVVYKGADTVIASPDGRNRVNVHASKALATAGSGDVLAGMIGAFLAQGKDSFDAASAAVWLHGEAGIRLGEGLICEDLPEILPAIFSDIERQRRTLAARMALKTSSNGAYK